jgi:trehalose-phosphatase
VIGLEKQANVPGTREQKISDFLSRVSCASARTLLLDYDGTIAPFCVDRNAAVPFPAVTPLLDRIQRTTNTRLVVITGRKASDISVLLDLEQVEIWGCHGLERMLEDGTYEMLKLDPHALSRLVQAKDLLVKEGLLHLIESKPAGSAVHWRGLEVAAPQIASKVKKVWSMLPDRTGLRLMEFDGGIEICLAERNKGDAVRTILAEMGDGVPVAYLGDDHTDEDAFAALRGRGLSILVNSQYRPTAADVWIRPPDEVVTFLSDWATACGGNS